MKLVAKQILWKQSEMARLCENLSIKDSCKILREIQDGNLDVIQTFRLTYPKAHWSDLRYEKTGDTILHIAARLGKVEVIEYLLTNFQPSGINCRNNDNKTALHEAAQFARHKVILLLITMGADVNSLKKADWTPLMLACTKIVDERSFKTVETLLMHGAAVNYQNKDGWTALHLICREGDESILKLLLKFSLDITKITKNGRSALHIAALHGNYDIVLELIKLGMDIDMRDGCGNTPLHEAVLGANLRVCDLVLASGADPTIRNKSDYSLLHLAASQDDVAVIKYVVDALKFDVNVCTRSGLTPLHCAGRTGKNVGYECLVQRGANEHLIDSFGRTPLDYKKM